MTWLLEDPTRLERFRLGDPEVLAEMYRMHVHDLARRLVSGLRLDPTAGVVRLDRNAYGLDDVLQETFARAFGPTARASYDGVRPFSTYLQAIARNVLIDRLRADRRAPAPLAPTDADLEASPQASPEETAMQRQLRALYARFRERLEPADRTLLDLRFVERRSRREVSEQTGLSAMAVRWRERRLRQALFAELRAAGYGVEGES